MKKVIKFSVLLLTMVAMMSLVSCGKDDEDLIIGKWNVTAQSGSYNVYLNGQLVESDDPFDDMSFNYFQFNNDGTGSMMVSIIWDDEDEDDWKGADKGTYSMPMPFKWTLNNDTLVLLIEEDEGSQDNAVFKVEALTKTKLVIGYKDTEVSDEGYTYVDEMTITMKKA